MNLFNIYYGKLIDLLYNQYETIWENASAGHCMKLSGLPETQLLILQNKVRALNPDMDCFVINETKADNLQYISATRLIELRNNESRPLFALIPINTRTAAEDSYSNATFQNIDLERIDYELFENLMTSFSDEVKEKITEVLKFLKIDYSKDIGKALNFILTIESKGFSSESIGNSLFHLGLIPDEILFDDASQTRARLNYNQISIGKLADFTKPIYERVNSLPLEKGTIQKDVVSLFRNESNLNSQENIAHSIAEKNTALNFKFWKIPLPNTNEIKLFVDSIKDKKGSKLENDDGDKILKIKSNFSAVIKLRVSTNPPPNQIKELEFFKVLLMLVDGNSQHSELAKFKNTASTRSYRDKIIEIHANSVEVGNYYLKVLALDKDGNILNEDDEFKDPKIESAWQEHKAKDSSANKSDWTYKLTCDSDNFYIEIDEDVDEEPKETRKAKLHNVLEAYFMHRIDQLKRKEDLTIPELEEEESYWSESKQKKLHSTYFVKYNNRHHYQIICSRKLKLIEQAFLKEPEVLGYCKVNIDPNPAVDKLDLLKLDETLLGEFAPASLLSIRKELFSLIANHCENEDGIFESFDWFNHIDLVKSYLEIISGWLENLKEQVVQFDDLSSTEARELNRLCQAIGNLDMTFVTTKLPDGKELEVALLSPLHPLRLYWFTMLYDLYHDWEKKTTDYEGHIEEWNAKLEGFFTGEWMPSNHPLIIPGILDNQSFIYAGELAFGWGLYIPGSKKRNIELLNTRQVISYFRRLFNIDRSAFVDTDVSKKIIIKHLTNFITQHPYVDKLVINIFNGGEAYVFADALTELEKEPTFQKIKYEIRLFEGKEKIIPFGQGLKELINPEFERSEQAEAFSQATQNRLFPKLRYSVSDLEDYPKHFRQFGAHITFIINPFPLGVTLTRNRPEKSSCHVNGLVVKPEVEVSLKSGEAVWEHFIQIPEPKLLETKAIAFEEIDSLPKQANKTLAAFQQFTANLLANGTTQSIPATKLLLSRQDIVLLSKIHDTSDWVVTLDRNLGPEIFDLPAKDESNPFLLDYVPGDEVAGVSSFLTTHPTSEILGLLGPHFEEFGLDVHEKEGRAKIKTLLEDLRAVSSSLILQLNSSENKAFEVIGTALAKRVLEKKGILGNTVIIPIDLHQSMFAGNKDESKSRADQLLVSIDPKSRKIQMTILEIKCRTSLNEFQKIELKNKIKEQVENTSKWLRFHFDTEYGTSYDRLDRNVKNFEFRSILTFYIDRARRYNYLSESAHEVYLNFLNSLDEGYELKFRELGFIFDFSAKQKHLKEEINTSFTCFTFGKGLMNEILDDTSDLDTNRLEKDDQDLLVNYFLDANDLTPFLKKLRSDALAKTIKPDTEIIKDKVIDTTENIIPEETIPVTVVEKVPQEDKKEDIETSTPTEVQPDGLIPPDYSFIVGSTKPSQQYGLLGKTIHGKTIAIDLDETVTISLFGVQGGGKSYSIGSVMEMVLKPIPSINFLPAPLAGVIFHFSESMDYEPEFTSMKYPNDKRGEIEKLKAEFGADPDRIEDIIILTPRDKVEERRRDYPSIEIQPIAFNSNELDAKAWMFLLGAMNNDSTYIRQLKSIMRQQRNNLTVEGIRSNVEESVLLSNNQKALALQRLQFAEEYIDDEFQLTSFLKPGRLIIVDLRDEFIMKDEALGLFVIMLNVFSGVTDYKGKRFNKFIVFDEAHKYMDNKDLAGKIVEAIREMRHKGVSIMIASQDPPSLPNEIIELSSLVITHKFNSPSWLKHIQKSITQLAGLSSADMSTLRTGEAFLWASKSTENGITQRPMKIRIRPRATKHGGGTLKAVE